MMLQWCQTGARPAPSPFWTVQSLCMDIKTQKGCAFFFAWRKHFSYRAGGLPLHLSQCHLHLGFLVSWLQEKFKDEPVLHTTWAKHCPPLWAFGSACLPPQSRSIHPDQQFAIEIIKNSPFPTAVYVFIWSKTWKKSWWVCRCAWGLLAAAMKYRRWKNVLVLDNLPHVTFCGSALGRAKLFLLPLFTWITC